MVEPEDAKLVAGLLVEEEITTDEHAAATANPMVLFALVGMDA